MNPRLSSVRKNRLKHKHNPQKLAQTIDVMQTSKQKSYKHKHPSFFLPPLQQTSTNEEFIALRNSIVETVRKLQDKLFIPHNASKKRNLQLIRKRKSTDYKLPNNNNRTRNLSLQQYNVTTSNSRGIRQISLDEKMSTSYSNRNEIASCSLEDTIFYG